MNVGATARERGVPTVTEFLLAVKERARRANPLTIRLRHAPPRCQCSNPTGRLPPPYASIHPARSAPLLAIQTVPAVDYVALPHHAV